MLLLYFTLDTGAWTLHMFYSLFLNHENVSVNLALYSMIKMD
jgi:hypothetical protein